MGPLALPDATSASVSPGSRARGVSRRTPSEAARPLVQLVAGALEVGVQGDVQGGPRLLVLRGEVAQQLA